MTAITRRIDKLKLVNAPKTRPLLILTLHEAGQSDSEPLRIDDLPSDRETGEPWDNYEARASLWHEQKRGDRCLVVMKVRYAE